VQRSERFPKAQTAYYRWSKTVIRTIPKFLNDAVLGFLALVSLFLLFAPSVFTLTPTTSAALAAAEQSIVALFAVEYVAGFILAANKQLFVLNRWRLLDALIIAAALIALFPAGPDFLRSSPVLRLLRLGRVALLGTRSGVALTSARETPEQEVVPEQPNPQMLALDPSGTNFDSVAWDEGIRRIGTDEPDWLFVNGVTEDSLGPIAAALRVPKQAMEGLFRSSVPRFGRLERFSTLFVRYPLPISTDGRLRRTPVLLAGTGDNVIVLTRESTDLEQRVETRLADLAKDMPRMIRATVALLGAIVRANTEIVESFESNLLAIEAEQSTLSNEVFLKRTFDLRTDILRVRSSLQHIRTVLRDIARGDLTLGALETEDRALFRLLAEDTNDLYDAIEDLRDSLQALVDLRLNVSSFQMNQVMRLLALLTALALIPATVGGLLGMNLAEAPWPGTLAQIAFGVAAGMALSLYIFVVKGWLR
jgi:Mg2+ and Co2+ transporter CorA